MGSFSRIVLTKILTHEYKDIQWVGGMHTHLWQLDILGTVILL